jgi:hypothetical protein
MAKDEVSLTVLHINDELDLDSHCQLLQQESAGLRSVCLLAPLQPLLDILKVFLES